MGKRAAFGRAPIATSGEVPFPLSFHELHCGGGGRGEGTPGRGALYQEEGKGKEARSLLLSFPPSSLPLAGEDFHGKRRRRRRRWGALPYLVPNLPSVVLFSATLVLDLKCDLFKLNFLHQQMKDIGLFLCFLSRKPLLFWRGGASEVARTNLGKKERRGRRSPLSRQKS